MLTDNASRYCKLDGNWDKSKYDFCHDIIISNKTCSELDFDLRCSAYATSIIYYIGYTISLVALISAVIVFINFK